MDQQKNKPLEFLQDIHSSIEKGDLFQARKICADALIELPDNPEIMTALGSISSAIAYNEARRRFPGIDYIEWLGLFHCAIRPRAYLEIGIAEGNTLALAAPPTLVIGIDPAYKITANLQTISRLFRKTSDQFFHETKVNDLLSGKRLDLALIDGLHTFEQALKDFINIEKIAHAGTIVLAHDVFPVEPITALRNRMTNFWVGDTWKFIPILIKYRPDLNIITIPTYPSGLAVISNLNPDSTVLETAYSDIVKEYMSKLDDKLLEAEGYLNVSSNDPEIIFPFLGLSDWKSLPPRPDEITSKPPSIAPYSNWLKKRSTIFNQIIFDNNASVINNNIFHIVIYINSDNINLLADTLDSLNYQTDANWHLQVISDCLPPEGIESIPCINWRKLEYSDLFKLFTESTSNETDWVIEIPAGTILDNLFIFRLNHELSKSPDALCFFFDDDLIDKEDNRHSPRFKPGVNREFLISTDLAGPLCTPIRIWLTTISPARPKGSPWFSQLLMVSELHGWHSIRHIPDILISYRESFPIDIESCISALIEHQQRLQINGEIIPLTNRSWIVRYPLLAAPKVTIAIISFGQLEFLTRCLNSIVNKTDYPNFEIIISLAISKGTLDLDRWLAAISQSKIPTVRVLESPRDANYACLCNASVTASAHEFILLLKEESVIVQEKWLEELVRTCCQSDTVAVSPRLIQPASALIENAGSVLGLNGIADSPYRGAVKLGEDVGYLDCINIARDVSTLPASCILVRKESYNNAGCMDEVELGDHLAETDLCLKLRKNGGRLIYQPLANLVGSHTSETKFDANPNQLADQMISEAHAQNVFSQRWYPKAAVDPFWNPNLSLAEPIPTPEIEYLAQWQFCPSNLPRLLAHSIPNAQGDFRVSAPLKALARAGLASACIWEQRLAGEARCNSISEIVRLKPDTIIVQNYIHNTPLAALDEWSRSGCQPFTIYALDDLISGMDASNPFSKNIPANARTRFQYALNRCHRLVVSTDYLANAYEGFIADIRVVPNRLEQAAWLPLRSCRRTGKKPRIGWAGGSTHQGDLSLLKEVIEQTRAEADWIFFGMCPNELRPLLAEYHPLVDVADYPAYLASLNFDIAVAPLAETAFNRGKSNLRLLEYGVLGIPVISTDIDPYRNSPVCLVKNIAPEWTEALRAHIHDPDGREREGDALRRWVLDNYLLENHLDDWLEAHQSFPIKISKIFS